MSERICLGVLESIGDEIVVSPSGITWPDLTLGAIRFSVDAESPMRTGFIDAQWWDVGTGDASIKPVGSPYRVPNVATGDLVWFEPNNRLLCLARELLAGGYL